MKLTPKEFVVLELLMARPGGGVGAEVLLDKAWDANADLLKTFLVGALIALTILGALAPAVGWLVTGRLLRPLHDIAAAAAAGSGHLDHRIARSGPEDELKDLSDTFDTMLASSTPAASFRRT